MSNIGLLTFFQIDGIPAAIISAGCIRICSLYSAILTSAMIRRSNEVRFRSISIAVVGVDFIAP
jgi:hypothetical protein